MKSSHAQCLHRAPWKFSKMIRDCLSKSGLGEIGDDSSCNGQRLVASGKEYRGTYLAGRGVWGVPTWSGRRIVSSTAHQASPMAQHRLEQNHYVTSPFWGQFLHISVDDMCFFFHKKLKFPMENVQKRYYQHSSELRHRKMTKKTKILWVKWYIKFNEKLFLNFFCELASIADHWFSFADPEINCTRP